jgi:hypothetical protein
MPTYNFSGNKNTAGLSFIGQTKAYAQDSKSIGNERICNRKRLC